MNYKSMLTTAVFAFFLVTSSLTTVAAQESASREHKMRIPAADSIQVLTTIDGSTLIGRIVEITGDRIEFETDLGRISVSVSKISDIDTVPMSAMKAGTYWFPNPNRTRLYFAPTARMLEQGEGYFADYYLFMPGFSFGVTDNFTLGGGFSVFPGLDFEDQVFYITPKIGIRASEQLNLAAGALIMSVPDGFDNSGNRPLVGILYGVGTVGTADHSFTIGMGYGFVDDDLADKPIVMLGADLRMSRKTAFVTENWILPGFDDSIISYGIRFLGEKISVDLAFLNLLGHDMIFPGIPYIDFVVGF